MSLRRPRIKTAVNLAALAGGRRKAPGPEEKAPESPKEPQPPEAEPTQPEPEPQAPAPVCHSETDVQPAAQPAVACESENTDERSSNNDDVSKHLEPVVPDEAPEISEPVSVAEAPEPVAGSSTGSIGEPRKDSAVHSEPKPLESPFSPPPARPAPLGRFKPKFRPNLGENRNRIRRYSGTLMDLVKFPCHVSNFMPI